MEEEQILQQIREQNPEGLALLEARYGSFILPMDEALIMTAVDISGRAHLSYDLTIPAQKVGDFDTELAEEFYLGFVRHAAITLHIK